MCPKNLDDFDDDDSSKSKNKPVKTATKPKYKTNIGAVKRIMQGIVTNDKFWKAQPGTNQIRILPSNQDSGIPFHTSILHHGFKDSTGRRAYPCLTVFKKLCPVCRVITFYDNTDDPDISSVIKQILPKKTYLMNIIDRAEPSKVKIYSCTPSVAQVIIGAFAEEDYGDITDPENGFDVVIKREGQGLNTRYKTLFRRNPSPIGVEGWEEMLYDLGKEAYREIPDYDTYCDLLEEHFGDVITNLERILKRKGTKTDKEIDKGIKETSNDDDGEEDDAENLD